jgi:hypothetical protein
MNSLQVMKQTLEYLENGHFTYETKIADDLRAAIQQEEANIQTQITKDISQPVAFVAPNGDLRKTTEAQDASEWGAKFTPLYTTKPSQPAPVKTYSGGKAWPVEVLPEGHRFTPFNNENLWVGLTDEEIEQEFGGIDEMLRDYVYRIEAKLKEKNSKG